MTKRYGSRPCWWWWKKRTFSAIERIRRSRRTEKKRKKNNNNIIDKTTMDGTRLDRMHQQQSMFTSICGEVSFHTKKFLCASQWIREVERKRYFFSFVQYKKAQENTANNTFCHWISIAEREEKRLVSVHLDAEDLVLVCLWFNAAFIIFGGSALLAV